MLLALGLASLTFALGGRAHAQEEDPFAAEDDPFADDAEAQQAADPFAPDVEPGTGEALPPPTVPDGYGGPPAPQAQPYPQQTQPAHGQPGYPAPRRRAQRVPYVEGMEIPEGARLVEKRRTGMVIAGAAMFGASYALSISLYAESYSFSAWMIVPVIGPFVEAGGDSFTSGDRFILVLDGLVQAAGLTLFIAGLVAKKRYVEVWTGNEPGWMLAPRVGPGGGGLDLRATF